MNFLSGLHPVIVHFPIAMLTLYSVFEIISLFYREKNFQVILLLFLGTAVLSGLAAVLTGNQAAQLCGNLLNAEQKNIINAHETFASAALFYYSFLFFVKLYLVNKKKFEGGIKYIYLSMIIIGNIFIYLTGYYGGRLVFEYGIGTRLFK